MLVTLVEVPKFAFPLNHASNVVIPPLGTAYIAAALEEAGHQVQVVDAIGEGMTQYTQFGPIYLRGLTFKEVADRIDRKTDMIGVSSMFSCQWPATRRLIEAVRESFPNRPIVLGGEHGSGMPEVVFDQSSVDYIVAGEGEETAVELAEHISSHKTPIEQVTGVFWRKNGNGSFVKNPRRGRLKNDIDAIPEPSWKHFRINDYINMGQPHGAVKGRYMPMLATRGCPYQCTFCTSPQMWTTIWVARDYRKVVDEMEKYMRQYDATDFHFEDLTAIVKRSWILEFTSEILRRGLKVTYQIPSGTRSEAIDGDVARALYQSGCTDFAYAPESGDERILKIIDKKVKLSSLLKSADASISQGMSISMNIIVGFPFDDWESIFKTYAFIVKCAWHGFSGVNINAYSPHPGTKIFHDLVNAGKIPKFDDNYFLSLFTSQSFFVKKTSYNTRFSSLQTTLIILLGFFLFYSIYLSIRPKRIYYLFKSFFQQDSFNKTTGFARAMVREMGRVWQFRRSVKKYRLA